ncbi:hypothetical protein [Nitratireductor aquibiodomus]|uniref:hypothetical protein n=1 Tax=Nitratireductor aquibiodomus TaxID=204799 RepID=UPI0004682B4B|nr:hypothetical protein [Nitratireductor aquibiodomus]
MFKEFSDIAPKAVLAAALVWGGTNYLLIGPEVAARVARADYLPACETDFAAMVARAEEARIRAVPKPQTHSQQDMAAAQYNALQSSPFMQQLRQLSGGGDPFGFNRAANVALGQLAEKKRMAQQAYESAITRIKEQTATDLARSGTVCGCVADAAIDDARTEWAVFSGTLGLIRPAAVREFDEQLSQVFETGQCTGDGGRS